VFQLRSVDLGGHLHNLERDKQEGEGEREVWRAGGAPVGCPAPLKLMEAMDCSRGMPEKIERGEREEREKREREREKEGEGMSAWGELYGCRTSNALSSLI
jgi:hypothetical protein